VVGFNPSFKRYTKHSTFFLYFLFLYFLLIKLGVTVTGNERNLGMQSFWIGGEIIGKEKEKENA
jgi:hypothetical protein